MPNDNDKPAPHHEIEAARAFARQAFNDDIRRLESAAHSLSGDNTSSGEGWGHRQVLKIMRLEFALALLLIAFAAVLFAADVFGFWATTLFGAAGLHRLALAVKHCLLARQIKRAIKAKRQIIERLQAHRRKL